MKSSLSEVGSVITVRSKLMEKGLLPTKSKMNVPYVEKDSTEEHLIAIRSKVIINVDMVEINGKVKCMFQKSSSQYGGIRSAINHVYILARVQMPERMKKELSIFIAGMDRTLISEKYMLGIKVYIGKNPSASSHMSSLQRYYLKAEKRGIFLHIYS